MTKDQISKEIVIENLEGKIKLKLDDIESSIEGLKSDRNKETKSSVGDKYETGRAMIQMELDKKIKQRSILHNDLLLVQQYKRNDRKDSISPGTLVRAGGSYFFLGIGMGKFQIGSFIIYAVSVLSPIGKLLSGLKIGDKFEFSGALLEIDHFQ